MRELELNPEIVNVNGGAIALGHPLGCTGAKLTVQIINEMKRRDSNFGMRNDVYRRRHGRGWHFPKSELALALRRIRFRWQWQRELHGCPTANTFAVDGNASAMRFNNGASDIQPQP